MSIIRNLKKKYKSFYLNIPYFEFADEGITALVGPSGSGKTSTLRVLSGLDPCPTLEWIFKDENKALQSIEKRKIGFVFQSLELFPHMTAYQNIQFAAKSSFYHQESDLIFLIENLDISHCLRTKADFLSRGEQQRVALARALAIRPSFLFLDEPFSSLDKDNKIKARSLVEKMVNHYHIPTLLVSHDEEDIQFLAHTLIKIEKGEIILTKKIKSK